MTPGYYSRWANPEINGVCPPGKEKLYPLLGMKKGHTGEDSRAPHGHPIYAAHDGIVREMQTEIERGLGLGIVSIQKYNLGKYGTHFVKTR